MVKFEPRGLPCKVQASTCRLSQEHDFTDSEEPLTYIPHWCFIVQVLKYHLAGTNYINTCQDGTDFRQNLEKSVLYIQYQQKCVQTCTPPF